MYLFINLFIFWYMDLFGQRGAILVRLFGNPRIFLTINRTE